jgi:hypothetical protein
MQSLLPEAGYRWFTGPSWFRIPKALRASGNLATVFSQT